jgi:hypothetical protein
LGGNASSHIVVHPIINPSWELFVTGFAKKYLGSIMANGRINGNILFRMKYGLEV